MALYVGNGKKLKIKMVNSVGETLTDAIYKLTVDYSMVENILLVSSDNFILTDKNGIYITVNNSEGENK